MVVNTEDDNNHISEAWQDALGRLVKSQGAAGPAVTYIYDPADHLTSALYGNALTQISYDIAGRKLSLDDPDMGLWSYAYDALGNLTRQTDARGQRICLYYDPLNRLSGKHYRTDDNCPSSPTYNVSYSYDAAGQRTGMTDASGSTSWTYTLRGLLETETKAITGAGTFATKYTYNSADLPINIQYPADNAGNLTALPSLTYTYHPQMTLDTLGSYVTGTTYDAAGRITSRSLGNGTSITNTFNAWNTPYQGGRLSNTTAVQSGATRQNLSYTYDGVGNISQIVDALGLTTNYTYDGLNRLDATSETTNNNPEYDTQTGNMLNLNGTQPATQYGYNDLDHLHAVTHIGGTLKYVYDLNGNMTQRPNQTLQYNAENQLTSVSGNVSGSFVYDGDGNRVKTTINGVTTAYIGNHTEWNVTAQEMTRYYLAGGQRVAFRVIKSGQADKVFYLLADHLGSTNVVMQVGGGVETKTYTAWGKDRTGSITKTDRQYTGQINEADLGLYFYNARYYDSYLNRWTQPDTIISGDSGVYSPLVVDYHETKLLEQLNKENRKRLEDSLTNSRSVPTNPLTFDRFSYTNNNPLSYTDPDGHFAFLVPLLAGAVIGGAISTAMYAIISQVTGQEGTLAGAARAFAGGAVAGAVSIIATPLAGTLLHFAGTAATGTALVAGTAAVNAVGGAASYLAGGFAQNAVDSAMRNTPTFKPTIGEMAANAAFAGVISPAVGSIFPVSNNTMSTLPQASHFMPGRTIPTLFATQNARHMYLQALVATGTGYLAGTGY